MLAATAATGSVDFAVNLASAAPPMAWWSCTFDGPAHRLGIVAATLRDTSGRTAVVRGPLAGTTGRAECAGLHSEAVSAAKQGPVGRGRDLRDHMLLALASCRPFPVAVSRSRVATCCQAEDLPSYGLTLAKPLGLAFEERDDGCTGLLVTEAVPGGSAAKDGTIWPGDLLLEVCGRDVSGMEFDDAMAVLLDAPERCDLSFGRQRGRAAALQFPDRLVFTQPGDPIMPLAKQAGFEVEYSCMQGNCGSCSMFLRDGESEEVRPVRMCRAKVPPGSLMPWEVLRPDSEEAKAYEASMEERLKRRATAKRS